MCENTNKRHSSNRKYRELAIIIFIIYFDYKSLPLWQLYYGKA
jgi:hypothetical protein